eukprot:435039-Rhodomonas_salina.1
MVQHTLAQYQLWYSIIRSLSTNYGIASYASSVTAMDDTSVGYDHMLAQCRTLRRMIGDLSTGYGIGRYASAVLDIAKGDTLL